LTSLKIVSKKTDEHFTLKPASLAEIIALTHTSDACHCLATMGRSKEQIIEATGGYRLGLFSPQKPVEAMKKKLLSGVPAKKREDHLEKMRRLQGRPSSEWDYEPND
jgi:hypothetical protein